MTQRDIFERVYKIVLTRGSDVAIESINDMYRSFLNEHEPDSPEVQTATFIKNELIRMFDDAQFYKDEISSRGISALDKDFFESQKISSDLLKQDLSSVTNTNTIFFNKVVVVTGVFSKYPNRNKLAEKLKLLGADINTTISRGTNIVCLGGTGIGPAKMNKVEELKASGIHIIMIHEPELYNILDKAF